MTLTASPRGKIYNSIIETIGGTPLVRLNKMPQEAGGVATVLAKLEFFNPLSSVKDRAALGMIEAAEESGTLKPKGTIVEATSGNTGIGLAFISAIKEYKLILTMPENMSVERQALLSFLGAEIVLTPAKDGMAGAIKKAEEIIANDKSAITMQQFSNPANIAIHQRTTAKEIWQDTKGSIDVFIACVGTAGTLQGVGSKLKELNSQVKIIAVQPAGSPVLTDGEKGAHKIQGIGAGFIPDNLDMNIIDEVIDISDEEALAYARALARKEGILAGISSGAAVAASLQVAKRNEMRGKTIVTLFPDSAERYLSTELFN